MTKDRDDPIRALSAKYNAAYRAHQVFAIAIAEFAMAGQQPPYRLQDREKEAASALAAVTEELRAAMAELGAPKLPAEASALSRTG